jgi:hypothetical protein
MASFGQYELSLLGASKAVELAFVFDPNFIAATA